MSTQIKTSINSLKKKAAAGTAPSIVASRQESVQFVDWVRVVVGRGRKKRKGVRRLMDCILVGDAKMYVLLSGF
jgi:hypothetical protein